VTLISKFHMKKAIPSIVLFLFAANSVFAQNGSATQTLQVANYKKNLFIFIQEDHALLASAGDTQRVSITLDRNAVHIAAKDTTKFYSTIALSEGNRLGVAAKYKGEFPTLSVGDAILTRARELGGITITNDFSVSGAQTTAGVEGDALVSTDEELPTQDAPKDAESKFPWLQWLWLPFAVLSGLMAYFVFTKKVAPPAIITQPVPTGADPELAQQLQKQLAALTAKFSAIEADKLRHQKYFKEVKQQIITPAKQALDDKNIGAALPLIVQGFYHLTAVANDVMATYSESDALNMQSMLGQVTQQKLEVFSQNTPDDHIPNEIKTLMALLKQHGADNLGDLVVQMSRVANLS
jgi:hypothetical protein